jgi:hypothetical protein
MFIRFEAIFVTVLLKDTAPEYSYLFHVFKGVGLRVSLAYSFHENFNKFSRAEKKAAELSVKTQNTSLVVSLFIVFLFFYYMKGKDKIRDNGFHFLKSVFAGRLRIIVNGVEEATRSLACRKDELALCLQERANR